MMATAIFDVKSIFFWSGIHSVKVTKEKATENRAALVKAAGRLFRERGIDGGGGAGIQQQGGLYAQFPSKEALAAEAFASALRPGLEKMTAKRAGRSATVTDFIDDYLSLEHRDNLAAGCPMSASASEIARQDKMVGERFSEGFEQFVTLIESGLGDSAVKADRRHTGLAIT